MAVDQNNETEGITKERLGKEGKEGKEALTSFLLCTSHGT